MTSGTFRSIDTASIIVERSERQRRELRNIDELAESIQRIGLINPIVITQDGVLVITAQETRSQERSREIALQKLTDLLRKAAHRPKRRIATKPTRASKTRRLDSKSKHARTKRLRSSRPDTD